MDFNCKLNPFGNYDDPSPPKTYRPKLNEPFRRLLWLIRNPLHNFMFYWIGIAGVKRIFVGNFLEDGWNISYTYTKNFTFPLISYKEDLFEFYIGWRRNGGFGIALRKANAKEASKVE